MKQKYLSIFLIVNLLLIGCAGLQTVSKYNSITPSTVDVNGKCFQVYLDRLSNSAYVDECPLASAANSYIEGLTLGIVDTTPSQESHTKALKTLFAKEYLDCEPSGYPFKIGDGMGGSYGYEFQFKCGGI